jgi:hypothetical protein
MKQTIIISSEELKRRAIAIINALPLDPVHELVTREHRKDRSAAQKGLYFIWVGVIANELGETKDDIHLRCKRQFLVPIYMRDDPYGYGSMMMTVLDVHRLGLKVKAKQQTAQIVKLTSTNDANVDQFREYLDDIEKYYITLGIILPHPEDRYIDAMQR